MRDDLQQLVGFLLPRASAGEVLQAGGVAGLVGLLRSSHAVAQATVRKAASLGNRADPSTQTSRAWCRVGWDGKCNA